MKAFSYDGSAQLGTLCCLLLAPHVHPQSDGEEEASPAPPTPPLPPEDNSERAEVDTEEMSDAIADEITQQTRDTPTPPSLSHSLKTVDCFVFALHRKLVCEQLSTHTYILRAHDFPPPPPSPQVEAPRVLFDYAF